MWVGISSMSLETSRAMMSLLAYLVESNEMALEKMGCTFLRRDGTNLIDILANLNDTCYKKLIKF